jgi:hypothetical protein
MADAAMTVLPVGNGDTVLIKLTDDTTIIFDCNIRNDAHDEENEAYYDVHSHLLEELVRDEKDRPVVDAFILTHADQDHCRGFQTSFHSGDPNKYKVQEDEPAKIIIGEIRFSRRIFDNFDCPLCEDAKAIKKEIERRIDLYKRNDANRDLPGNRLRVIGYGESEETQGLDQITTEPGNAIDLINGSTKEDFSFFVHAPFKRGEDESDVEQRNNSSIVLQACFKVDDVERACLILLGGDAPWDVWRALYRKSKEIDLQWDLLLSPHHCSWSFFNNTPHADNKDPQQSSLDVLDRRREGAFVVASSKPIKDDDCNPPHYAAKQEYVKVVGEAKFYCVGEIPSEEKPEPVIFTMTSAGPVRDESSTPSRVSSAAAVNQTLRSPRHYG